MGGIQYVFWPGTSTRLTPWMLHCLERLDADLQRLFGVRLALDSSATQRGIRTNQEQINLFLSRYRVQASGSGPFGDVRYWRGRRYVRHSGPGTVATPDTSNHEIQGDKAAVDLADTGGAGIGTMGSARSNWLRKNAANYGLIPEGFSFAEAWHYAVPNIFTPVPAGSGQNIAPPLEDDEMLALKINAGANGVHFCTLTVGVFSHMISGDNPEWIKNVVRSDDAWTDVPIERLPALLRRWGCDLHIWDIRGGHFVVLDPLTGQATPGGMWSAVNAARSKLTTVEITSAETRAYLEQLQS